MRLLTLLESDFQELGYCSMKGGCGRGLKGSIFEDVPSLLVKKVWFPHGKKVVTQCYGKIAEYPKTKSLVVVLPLQVVGHLESCKGTADKIVHIDEADWFIGDTQQDLWEASMLKGRFTWMDLACCRFRE